MANVCNVHADDHNKAIKVKEYSRVSDDLRSSPGRKPRRDRRYLCLCVSNVAQAKLLCHLIGTPVAAKARTVSGWLTDCLVAATEHLDVHRCGELIVGNYFEANPLPRDIVGLGATSRMRLVEVFNYHYFIRVVRINNTEI